MSQRRNPGPAMGPKNEEILLDHIINLTDQVRRLAGMLRAHGIEVPDDLGTLGPAREETVQWYTEESYRLQLPHLAGCGQVREKCADPGDLDS